MNSLPVSILVLSLFLLLFLSFGNSIALQEKHLLEISIFPSSFLEKDFFNPSKASIEKLIFNFIPRSSANNFLVLKRYEN